MSKIRSQQSGFGLIEALSIIAALSLIAIIGYKVVLYQAARPPSRAEVLKAHQEQAKDAKYELDTKSTTYGTVTKATITLPLEWESQTRHAVKSELSSDVIATGPLDKKYPDSWITPRIEAQEVQTTSIQFDMDTMISAQGLHADSDITKTNSTIAGLPATTLTYKHKNQLGRKLSDPPYYEYVTWTIIGNDKIIYTFEMSGDEKQNNVPLPLYSKVLASFKYQ